MADLAEPDDVRINNVDTERLVENAEEEQDDRQHNVIENNGLGIFSTALLLTGEMAGSGVLALSNALHNTGWSGLALIVVCCLASGYNGTLLGACWNMLLERDPEVYAHQHVRYPYPAIVKRAMGEVMMWVTYVAIMATLFGVCVVFVLIAAENIQSLLYHGFDVHISSCYWVIIISACLIPVAWLESPKNLWLVAGVASGTTALASVLIVIATGLDTRSDTPPQPTTPMRYFLAIGTVAYSFGGAATFPTVQHDMRTPRDFPKAVVICYSALLAMYIPVSVTGYYMYQGDVSPNIINNLQVGALRITVEILITMHLIFAFSIALNPCSQMMEEAVGIPNTGSIKRYLLRTAIVCCIMIAALSVPHFGVLLDLLGGFTVSFLTFIMPSLSYLMLSRQQGDWPQRRVLWYVWVICVVILLVGITAGGASTYAASSKISNSITTPCFRNMTVADV